MKKQLTLKISGRVISKKNSKRVMRTRSGKVNVLSSAAYETFRTDAIWQIREQLPRGGSMVQPPYFISYFFKIKGKMRIDLDNAIASINDILQETRVIDDDININGIGAMKDNGYQEWETIVKIATSSKKYIDDLSKDV